MATTSSKLAAEMDRAGLAGRVRRPRHAALDGEVDLERARAVAEPAVRAGDAARQPVAEDVGGDRRRHVEHQHVARREVGRPTSPDSRSRSCRRGVRCRPPARRRSPASRLRPPPNPWRGRRRSASARRRSSSAGRVGRTRAPPRRPRAPWPARSSTAATDGGGRQHRPGAEARQRQRMARHPQDRLGGVGEQVVEVRRRVLEHPAPPATVARPARRRSARSIGTSRRPIRRRADGRSRPPAAASVSPSCRQVEFGQERRRRRRSDGPPSSGRAPGRGRSSPSCGFRRRSCRSPRARSRRGRHVPGAPRQRARSARCRRRSPNSRRQAHAVTGCERRAVTPARRCRGTGRRAPRSRGAST